MKNYMMTRILFLDIDGVLNSEEFCNYCLSTEEGKEFIKDGGDHNIDPKKVKLIEDLCNDHYVGIVLSSSWRMISLKITRQYLMQFRDLQPIIKYIVGITPLTNDRYRGEEIKTFLDNMNDESSKYDILYDRPFFKEVNKDNLKICIVDDDNDMLDEQEKYFVQTDWKAGLTEQHIVQIKNILGIEK